MAPIQDTTATPPAVPPEPTESVQPALGYSASADEAENTAKASAPSTSAADTSASVTALPVEMAVVAALALLVAGVLSRIRMIGRRIIVDRPETDWMDSRNERELRDRQQHSRSAYQSDKLVGDFVGQADSDERKLHDRQQRSGSLDKLLGDFIGRSKSDWADDRNDYELRDRQQQSGSAHQGDKLTDDLQRPVEPASADYEPPLRKDGSREKPQPRDREPDVAHEISKREETLEQLKRELDRLWRSPKVA